MRPRIALPLIALLVVTAGCTATGPSGTDTTASPTQTPTQTPTPLPVSPPPTTVMASPESPSVTSYATDCPPRLHVEAATEQQVSNADDVVAYEDLPSERQREFDRALESGGVELDSIPETWGEPRVVTYEGKQYATVVSVC